MGSNSSKNLDIGSISTGGILLIKHLIFRGFKVSILEDLLGDLLLSLNSLILNKFFLIPRPFI